MTQNKAIQLLKQYKIPFAKYAVCKTKKELMKSANKLGYPLVMKVISPDVIHKTESGGVVVGINDEAELVQTYSLMLGKMKMLKARVRGVMLQEVMQGREVIVGMKRDVQFGPVILFGLGGIYVEVLNDVALRIAPVGVDEAKKMMSETKGYNLLKGVRGEKKANLDLLADMISKFSAMVMKMDTALEIDLNPVMVNETSAKVVDVRVLM